ncbi:hypothetical protein DPMN_160725 [Dreissena polymorpha]|uniref:BHLH domain-containing protein n=1 Tax=Dreissena polymorpha TaxID=45954 RepID=A0A9D4ERP3_DREPO|nr:hypothetical protein DPMN_160725 [Dreissena polymorpha]
MNQERFDFSSSFSNVQPTSSIFQQFSSGSYNFSAISPLSDFNRPYSRGEEVTLSKQYGIYRSPKCRGRPIANNAARERSRVKTLRTAFLELQRSLPAVPPDTKLSKLDILVLATTYIAHLMSALQNDGDVSHIFAANGCMHPVKVSSYFSPLYLTCHNLYSDPAFGIFCIPY